MYYMANKTLYVKDSDLPIWEQAEKIAVNGVSSLVTMLLKTYVDQHPVPDEQGMMTITVECRHFLTIEGFQDTANTVKKSFVGRWLISPEEKLTQTYATTETNLFAPNFYAIAQTKKGAIAVYEGDDRGGDDRAAELNHYRTFEEFQEAQLLDERQQPTGRPRYPENVIAAVAEALQREYVVHLDI
jgi:hypothetical protein